MLVFSHLVMSASFVTPWTVALQAPLSMGILQARILEWIAMPPSGGSFQPRDWTQVSRLQADSLPSEPLGKPKNTGVDSLSLLQGNFPTQEKNQGLLYCRILLSAELPGKPTDPHLISNSNLKSGKYVQVLL